MWSTHFFHPFLPPLPRCRRVHRERPRPHSHPHPHALGAAGEGRRCAGLACGPAPPSLLNSNLSHSLSRTTGLPSTPCSSHPTPLLTPSRGPGRRHRGRLQRGHLLGQPPVLLPRHTRPRRAERRLCARHLPGGRGAAEGPGEAGPAGGWQGKVGASCVQSKHAGCSSAWASSWSLVMEPPLDWSPSPPCPPRRTLTACSPSRQVSRARSLRGAACGHRAAVRHGSNTQLVARSESKPPPCPSLTASPAVLWVLLIEWLAYFLLAVYLDMVLADENGGRSGGG